MRSHGAAITKAIQAITSPNRQSTANRINQSNIKTHIYDLKQITIYKGFTEYDLLRWLAKVVNCPSNTESLRPFSPGIII